MLKIVRFVLVICLLVHMARTIKLNEEQAKRKAVCILPSSYGSCKGSQVKWHYSFVRDRCVSFNYSSCGGNRNRFDTRDSCIRYCMNPIYRYYMQDFEEDYD